MNEYLVPITTITLPPISDLQGRQGMFILPDGSININKKDGTWLHINKQSDHAGVLKPTDVVSVQPGSAKWYWAGPGVYNNVSPGFNIDKLGIISYDGAKWGLVNVEIMINSKKVFDPANDNDPSTMKAAADRYDWTTVALQNFGDSANTGTLTLTWAASIILSDGTVQANANHSMSEIPVPVGYKFFNFKGPMWNANAPVDTYSTILAKLKNGSYKVLLKGDTTSSVVDKSIYITDVATLYINSKNNTLNTFTTSFSNRGVNSVKEYMDAEILKLAAPIDFSKALEKSMTEVKYNKISDINIASPGNGLLNKDNTIAAGTEASYRNLQNVPTNNAKYMFYCAQSYTGTEAQLEIYASLIGIKKNGELTILIKGTTDATKETIIMLDISSYEKISFCWVTKRQTDGWQPIFSFYNVVKKVNFPNIPKAKNLSLNNDIKGGAVTFVDDDINGAALGGLAPFMHKNGVPFGVACISAVAKANPNTMERILGFYNLGLIDIINHTESHLPNMNGITYDEQYQEIKKCKDYLDSFGLINDMYASPYGNFNQDTLDILNLLGYNFHFRADTASNGLNSVDTFYNMGIYRLNFGLIQPPPGNTLTKEQIKSIISQAHSENKLVVIMTHFRNNGSNPSDFFTQLQEIIDHCRTTGTKILRPREAVEKFSNIIEVDNGFRITRNGKLLTDHIPLSAN
ncbi:polysaccharide deacetylase family protein [Chryseobacterium oncorhynchi]|uniref:NodB homology domain-containing protein n=1 Tax=Chryseobacterium oncorhynchi TaxID=741074 RepID=A0A316X5G2_9FLAO|nr:polysaccharide deacetylase family protein [Chryseobacterium oncorhynchi]PWN67613.1 hypothetical protein C1638_003210 [Chryseobacterium oncorhynchi]